MTVNTVVSHTETRKDKIRRLEAEIEQLREALAIREMRSLEEWGGFGPQSLRDQMAASAYIAERMSAGGALKRLGFDVDNLSKDERRQYAEKVFGTEGVAEILAQDAEKFSGDKEAVLRRLAQTAKHGTDKESVYAATVLSRMIKGWAEGDKDARSGDGAFNFLLVAGGHANKLLSAPSGQPEMLGDPDAVIDAESFLVHDVGEAALVEDAPEPQLHR